MNSQRSNYNVMPWLWPNGVYHIAPFVDKVPDSPHDSKLFLVSLYEQIKQKQVQLWLAFKDGRCCGYALVYPPSPMNNAAFIYHAYIQPGTPLWVAMQMKDQIVEWAKAGGAKAVSMTTTRERARAWERFGFKAASVHYVMHLGEEENGKQGRRGRCSASENSHARTAGDAAEAA